MGEDKSGKRPENESRPPLGDVTNQLGKRGFNLISRSSASKSKIENNIQSVDDITDTDSHFWKQVSIVVEKLEKERGGSITKCPKISNEVGLSPLKGGKTYRLLNASGKGLSKGVCDTKEPIRSVLDSIDLDGGSVGDDAVKECCGFEVKVGESSKCSESEKDCVEEEMECRNKRARIDSGGVGEDDDSSVHEVLGTQVVSDCLTSSKAESGLHSRLAESREIKGFGLERCTAFKGDGGCSLAAGVDLLKHCSCSFCTKAAYIWSDLHYKDVKGRISMLAKSQKEASNFAQKYSMESEMSRQAQASSSNAAQLESDLMSQWRSLFLQMEDMFGSEGSQLQNSFLALKDLREDFKINLEMINGVPLDVQQSSSESSDHTIV